MKRHLSFILLLLLSASAVAQERICDRSDSIFIEKILSKHSIRKYSTTGELALAVASEFIGREYVAGTLENGRNEPLYISCTKVDCSTFVELATAITVTIASGEKGFNAVSKNLEKIRYRNGVRDGYASRLHYTTWWIDDNIKKGIIEEVTNLSQHKQQPLNLHFMSSNSDKYPALKDNAQMRGKIEELEKPFRGITISYIPKALLNLDHNKLKIENGDIIALVTTIDGLDISHVGFAFWKNGNLHLLHASSAKKMVIKDAQTLHSYQKNKKKQTGIRVLRIK